MPAGLLNQPGSVFHGLRIELQLVQLPGHHEQDKGAGGCAALQLVLQHGPLVTRQEDRLRLNYPERGWFKLDV